MSKVQVRASQTLILSAIVTTKSEGLTDSEMDFHFLVGIFAIFGELGNFLYWMGPVPYLELFWAGPVKTFTPYMDMLL